MPGLLARIPQAWNALTGTQRKSDPLEAFLQIGAMMRESWAGKPVTLSTAIKVSAALACGRVISEGLAMLPLHVMSKRPGSIQPAADHVLYDRLLVQPNPLQSAFEFKETMGLHLAFVGNAFIWVTRVGGEIDDMYLLEPRWVTLEYSWPKPPRYKVRTTEGNYFELAAADVWHVRGPSWMTYLGLEFIQIAREALGLSMAIEESQARTQGQGVQTSGFLSVDGTLTDEQNNKLRAWIEKEHSGSFNAGRAMILDRAAKWMSTAMSNVDAQTVETRQMQVEEVCRFMRVMPIMVGVSNKVATYASAEQMFLAHLVHTMGSWVSRIENSGNRWLLSTDERKRGLYLKFNEKAMHRMTAVDQMTFLTQGTTNGLYTRNEARAELGLNPLPGLDDPLTPVNTAKPPTSTPAAPEQTPADEDAAD